MRPVHCLALPLLSCFLQITNMIDIVDSPQILLKHYNHDTFWSSLILSGMSKYYEAAAQTTKVAAHNHVIYVQTHNDKIVRLHISPHFLRVATETAVSCCTSGGGRSF